MQSSKVGKWEHSRLCKARKLSLSYSRMEPPLWPHKQKEALWTLHKCLALRGWTALEAGRYGKVPGRAASSEKLRLLWQTWHCPGICPGGSLFLFWSFAASESWLLMLYFLWFSWFCPPLKLNNCLLLKKIAKSEFLWAAQYTENLWYKWSILP